MAEIIKNTAYFPPIYDKQAGFRKTNRSVLFLSIYDTVSKLSVLKKLIEPTVKFYVVKEEFRHLYTINEMMAPIDHMEEYEVIYDRRDYFIALALGLRDKYSYLKKNDYESFRQFKNEELMGSPFLYQGDIDIEDYYKNKYFQESGLGLEYYKAAPLNKGFLDIEIDLHGYDEDMATSQNPFAVVNLASLYISSINTLYGFIIKNDELPAISEVENNQQAYLDEYVYSDDFNFPDKSLNVELLFFGSEELLLMGMFAIINRYKPDFGGIWFMNFDIPYLLKRAQRLGMDSAKMICDPDLEPEFQRVDYKEDYARNNRSKIGDKKEPQFLWDSAYVAATTQYIDQMSLYANLRKTNKKESYKLDSITELELGSKKVDLDKFGMTVRNAYRKDFKLFLQYSLIDTYLLKRLEDKCRDIDKLVLFTKNTRYSKSMAVSYVSKMKFKTLFEQEGYVLGNDQYSNADGDEKASIVGGLVGDPLMIDIPGLTILGKRIKVFEHAICSDFASLYPNLIIQYNICKNTIDFAITRIVGDDDCIRMSGYDFCKFMQTKESSIYDMMNKMCGLPDICEIIKDINQELAEV